VPKLSPTLFQIISTDYFAQNFFIMIFGGWAIYFVDSLFAGHTTRFLAILAAVLTPIGLLTFYWRYNLIVSTFANGIEIQGKVVDLNTISSGNKYTDYIIDYEYTVNGQVYQSHNRVKKNAFAKKLGRGQTVNLLVHEKTPQIAFIKEIYLEFI